MRRHAIGAIALVLLGATGALWLWPPGENGWPAVEAALWRVGAVMAVLWLAYNDVRRMPPWLLGAIPVAIVLLAVKPRWFLFVLPLLIVIGVLHWLKRRPGA